MGRILTRENLDGVMEGYDEETGQVVWVEKVKTHGTDGRKLKQTKNSRKSTHHVVRDRDGNKVLVPKGTNPDILPRSSRAIWPYSEVTAELIVEHIGEGKTMRQIGRMEGFPNEGIIKWWKMHNKEFARRMREAEAHRAEHFHDKVVDAAEEIDEDNFQAKKAQIDAYKWVAEVNDPEKFGKRTKITGDADHPLGFIIDTGIRRDAPIDVDCEPVPAALPAPETDSK